MKNILFISPTNTLDNGAEISVFHLMELLVKRGHKVVNVAANGLPQDIEQHRQKYKQIGVDSYYLNSVKWWWEDAPGGYPLTPHSRASSYRDAIAQIKEIINQQEIDVVVTNTVNVFQGAVAAALTSRPHFWLIHELPENEFAYYQEKCDFISDFGEELFTVAGGLETALQSYFPKRQLKTFVPYNQHEKVHLEQGKVQRFVSIGRLNERKNQLELLKAYRLVRRELGQSSPDLVFIGGADKSYLDEMKAYIKENRLKGVQFLGHIDHPWQSVTDKDIMVFPSSMETFGLVYVESLMNGLPTIFSDNMGHRTAYDLFKAGQMYKVGDVDDLAHQMKAKLENFDMEFLNAQQAKENAHQIYQPEQCYRDLIASLETVEQVSKKMPIRHLDTLLTLNSTDTRLVRYARKTSQLLTRIKMKLKR